MPALRSREALRVRRPVERTVPGVRTRVSSGGDRSGSGEDRERDRSGVSSRRVGSPSVGVILGALRLRARRLRAALLLAAPGS